MCAAPQAAPFYAWVREQNSWEPNWNFNKVLIGRDGRIAGTFGSGDETGGAEGGFSGAIEAELAQGVVREWASSDCLEASAESCTSRRAQATD